MASFLAAVLLTVGHDVTQIYNEILIYGWYYVCAGLNQGLASLAEGLVYTFLQFFSYKLISLNGGFGRRFCFRCTSSFDRLSSLPTQPDQGSGDCCERQISTRSAVAWIQAHFRPDLDV